MKRFVVALACLAAAAGLGFVAATAPAGATDTDVAAQPSATATPTANIVGPQQRLKPVETGLYGVVLDEDSLPVEGAEVYAVSLGEEFDFADDSSAEDAGWFEDVEEVPGEPVLTNSDGSNAPLRERPAGKA